jgi:hypothetical protein
MIEETKMTVSFEEQPSTSRVHGSNLNMMFKMFHLPITFRLANGSNVDWITLDFFITHVEKSKSASVCP